LLLVPPIPRVRRQSTEYVDYAATADVAADDVVVPAAFAAAVSVFVQRHWQQHGHDFG
jgi:hypothetical protein